MYPCEEMALPVPSGQLGQGMIEEMQRRYAMHPADAEPRVYCRLTAPGWS